MITEYKHMQYTTEGFINEFWNIYRSNNISMMKAYELTEEKHYELFNSHRFSSFDSFRVILNRRR